MARRRLKTRVDLLAEGLEAASRVVEDLHKIDLRRTRGDLRDRIREARSLGGELREALAQAVRLDLPPRPPVAKSRLEAPGDTASGATP